MNFFKKEMPRGIPERIDKIPINFGKVIEILNYNEEKHLSRNESQVFSIQEPHAILGLEANRYLKYVKKNLKDLGIIIKVKNGKNYVRIDIQKSYFLVEETIDISFNKFFKTAFDIRFRFKNNTFFSEEKDNNININLYGGGFINFKNNKFENIGLKFYEKKNNSRPGRKHVNLKNNKIYSIESPSHFSIAFRKHNEIEKINIYEDGKESRFAINWSPYQKINTEELHAEENRDSFIILKVKAVEKNDKLQEFYLNREILKCDQYLIKQWQGGSLQDSAIMWFGKWSSDHGISLVLPIWRLLLINALFALSTLPIAEYGKYCLIDTWQLLNIWAQMLNPLSSLANTTGIEGNFIISTISAIQKGVLALLIYEAIRVGRRFTPK